MYPGIQMLNISGLRGYFFNGSGIELSIWIRIQGFPKTGSRATVMTRPSREVRGFGSKLYQVFIYKIPDPSVSESVKRFF